MLPELVTARFVLRELSEDDAAELAAWRLRPYQWQQQAVEPPSKTDVVERVANYLKYRGDGSQRRLYDYTARPKAGGELIGSVSLERTHGKVASIGVSVAEMHTGNGYATELARRMLVFGFDDLGLHRIAADVAVENLGCRRVMEKIGMPFEGISRDCIFAQGRRWCEARYAMLAPDHAAAMHQAKGPDP